ncbi:MAG: amino acid adenylation domain-containing protein [Lachnospiraceae bacterium]|nr:amino acid adenylation domain-containing protein [Lachnospiraceae bacterium]
MITERQMDGLNLSQREIAMTELSCPGSGKNTISLKLFLPRHTSQQVKKAADIVLDSADIFAAFLRPTQKGWRMDYGREKKDACRITEEQSADAAEEYMDSADRQPMNLEGSLYQAEVIPLLEGGVFLYVRFHHIIIDGYGMSLFVQRVLDVLAGKKIKPSLFAARCGNGIKGDSSFWSGYFSDAEFEPSIFSGKATGMEYGSYRVPLPDIILQSMKFLGRQEDVSIPYIAAAAYAFYLAQATDRPDAVFLMPRLNRTKEQKECLGCYTLLVPVRVSVSPEDTFGTLCRKVKKAAREASAHKDAGFDEILSRLREENVIADTVSEYVFNFYRFSFRTDLPFQVRFNVAGGMQNHITFNLFYNESGGLDVQFDYQKSIYTSGQVRHLCDALFLILSEGVQNRKLSNMQTIGEGEYQKIISVTGKSLFIEPDDTISSLFRRAVKKYRDRPAVYAGDVTMSFEELDEMSDRIACGLLRCGVQKGDGAAFLLKRDFRLIPAILGISKAGAAFIPIDPAYPMERISYIVENSRARCILSSKDVEIAENYDYIEIDALAAQEPELDMLPQIGQEDLAYMIYTSGTTGRPKGVMLSHRGIANIVHPDNNPFNRDVTKNCHGIAAIGSICFDISLFEIFVPLMNGLFVELGSEKAMLDAGELAAHILRHHADMLHCTPSRILAYLGNEEFSKALCHVKAILAAGEVLPGSLVRRLKDTYKIRMYNGYGPTETTIGATITEAGDTESIGRPIGNMGVVLLNQNRRPVPFGAVGEICVYGSGVGIGYKDRPEETKSKYIIWNGIRIYRTGDLGYFSKEKNLIYCGRNDRQVKLRGLRIELSEIENVMGEFPGIASCSCMVRKIDKTEHLVGFYTVVGKGAVNEEQLKKHMKSRLTSYMVPDVIKELAEMPQTPNGKTDWKALEAEPLTYTRVYRKPETEKERQICSVFEETLKVSQIGLDDNFFELGGDSLSAAAAVLCIEETLNLRENQLEFGDLYRFPTPALLLEKIYKKQETDCGFDIKNLNYQGVDEYLKLHVENEITCSHLGNVLVTGVTGYLGIHILIDLLRHPECCDKIVCLARPKRKLSAEKRVKSSLFYYAEEDFSCNYGEKWLVVEGDITEDSIFARPCPVSIDTIINSAADVAHFSYGDDLDRINRAGVRNLIDYAQKEHAMLCQISTISVSGMTMESRTKEPFCEKDFYVGQEIHNKYIYSKYMAEYEMLRAAVDEGLKIKILRVGNLQGRISDGEFQMNLHSNAFTRQFSSYIKMGAVPQSVYEGSVNFSPVDETAHNIVTLTATGEGGAVFHVYPPVELKFADLFEEVRAMGSPIEVLPEREFEELLRKLRQTEEGRERLQGLVTNEYAKDYHEIPVIQEITERRLEKLSGGWSVITDEYIRKYLSALQGMGLF